MLTDEQKAVIAARSEAMVKIEVAIKTILAPFINVRQPEFVVVVAFPEPEQDPEQGCYKIKAFRTLPPEEACGFLEHFIESLREEKTVKE